MRHLLLPILFSLVLLSPSSVLSAGAPTQENYLKTEDYISAALGKKSDPPGKPSIIWATGEIKSGIKKILRRSNFPLRFRYHRRGNRTVWILNEIGKVLPITTGVTIEDGKIIDLTVLTYRESHGSEIRFPTYSNQFNNAELTENLRLSKPINGISGATLSTNAMKKVSRLALYLHSKVLEKDVTTSK